MRRSAEVLPLVALALALALALAAVAVLAATVAGADASSVPSDVLAGGDLRSDGGGPGLVGNPLLILAAVVGLALVTAGVTALLVRLAQRD